MKDALARKTQAFASLSMRVRSRSATPFSYDLSADVISCLMRCFLQISLNFSPFSSLVVGPNDLRDPVQTDVSQPLLKLIRRLSLTAQKVFPRHPSLIIPKIMAYWLSPFDLTAFLPLRSTKTLPSFLSERDSVTLLTCALIPFATEHPTHGSSLLPFFRLTPCSSADLSNRWW